MTSHHLKHIRLELARSKEYPSGSTRHGYDLIAPLDEGGHIDSELWQKYRKNCRVRRFWDDEDEEAGYRFGAHKFANGEYVSIRDHEGQLHTFRVTSVEPMPQ